MLTPESVAIAHQRIQPFIRRTPLLESSLLNEWLGHRIMFKVEGQQKIGAFKFRGAMNVLLTLKEQGKLPEHVVAFSSGNHAQAVAYSAKLLGIKATLFIPKLAAKVKQQATRAYGAEVIVTDTRQDAEQGVKEYERKGCYFIPPYDSDDLIAGQGTACLEALQDGPSPDVIFATCGGGGWLSGTYLAAQLLAPQAKVYGAEPLQANDAAQSLRQNKIVQFEKSPETIADGARTLAVAERTFHYLKKLAGMYEVPEDDILYWSQWLNHLLKTTVEPTSAVAMAGLVQWLCDQSTPKTALVMLSGGNLSPEAYRHIWKHDYLQYVPHFTTDS